MGQSQCPASSFDVALASIPPEDTTQASVGGLRPGSGIRWAGWGSQGQSRAVMCTRVTLSLLLLSALPHPEVIRIHSVTDIPAQVEAYYLQGYVVGALHPILHPAGPRAPLPASHLYRAVLLRPRAR